MNSQPIDTSLNKVIIIIDEYKFDVTNYVHSHPGGKKILQQFNNKDATEAFNQIHGHYDSYVLDLLDKYCIGKC
jgi:cytochrome b involved in lipid metabolism|tara:strand:+ start:112 stop:333 length:222 start_codon:yes stop_codon:yes gene_type:complete